MEGRSGVDVLTVIRVVRVRFAYAVSIEEMRAAWTTEPNAQAFVNRNLRLIRFDQSLGPACSRQRLFRELPSLFLCDRFRILKWLCLSALVWLLRFLQYSQMLQLARHDTILHSGCARRVRLHIPELVWGVAEVL